MVVRKLDDVDGLVGAVLVATTALTACCCDDDTAEDIRLPLQLVLDVRCFKKGKSQQQCQCGGRH